HDPPWPGPRPGMSGMDDTGIRTADGGAGRGFPLQDRGGRYPRGPVTALYAERLELAPTAATQPYRGPLPDSHRFRPAHPVSPDPRSTRPGPGDPRRGPGRTRRPHPAGRRYRLGRPDPAQRPQWGGDAATAGRQPAHTQPR